MDSYSAWAVRAYQANKLKISEKFEFLKQHCSLDASRDSTSFNDEMFYILESQTQEIHTHVITYNYGPKEVSSEAAKHINCPQNRGYVNGVDSVPRIYTSTRQVAMIWVITDQTGYNLSELLCSWAAYFEEIWTSTSSSSSFSSSSSSLWLNGTNSINWLKKETASRDCKISESVIIDLLATLTIYAIIHGKAADSRRRDYFLPNLQIKPSHPSLSSWGLFQCFQFERILFQSVFL